MGVPWPAGENIIAAKLSHVNGTRWLPGGYYSTIRATNAKIAIIDQMSRGVAADIGARWSGRTASHGYTI